MYSGRVLNNKIQDLGVSPVGLVPELVWKSDTNVNCDDVDGSLKGKKRG
jgi:hypothetical protein